LRQAADIDANVIDLESVERLIERSTRVFEKFRREEPARTALGVLVHDDGAGLTREILKARFSALPSSQLQTLETAISNYLTSTSNLVAADLFGAMARATRIAAKASSEIHGVIVAYVRDLADLWRTAGLRPSRCFKVFDPRHRSPFHIFADLLLTATVEPWSLRHVVTAEEIRRRSAAAHAAAAASVRSNVIARPRRADSEWLISDDHLKKALGQGFKNRT
jgi:hypothetical protein